MPHQTTVKISLSSRIRVLSTLTIIVFLFPLVVTATSLRDASETNIFSKCWDYKLVPNLSIEMALDATTVFVPDIENKVHAIDLSAAGRVWSSEFGGDLISNLLVVEDSVVFGTNSQTGSAGASGKTVIRAVSRQTGITLWQADVRASQRIWFGAVNGSAVAVGSEGWISSFTSSDGKLVWSSTVGSGVVADPLFRNDEIRIATKNNEVLGVDGQTGKSRRLWKSEHSPSAILSDSAGRLLVGDDRGNLTAVSGDGDRLWSFRNGAQISSVLEYDAEYIAASYDNFIYKLSRGGNVEWKRRLPGRVNGRVALIGDTAVIAIVGTGSVYGVNLRNGKISNRIESGEEVSLTVTSNRDVNGFVMAGPGGLSYYGSKCPSK